jgi:ATP-binding cassette subfamily C (CFTR/MRP) protein 1
LVSAIYDKTMEISITALENSQAVSLMSTDLQQIVDGLKFVHELWANVIQIAVATWLLSREIGVACVAPLVVSLGIYHHLKGNQRSI